MTQSMTLREQQALFTRNTILDAAEEIFFSDSDPTAITMQTIADRAGVSHRTLYRHFATRDDLVSAVGRRMDHAANQSTGLIEPATFDEWIAGIVQAIRFGALHRDQLRRVLALGVSGGVWRQDRDVRYYEMFRQHFPHLDDDTAREDFVALRHLLSSTSVITVGERFELSPEQVASAIQRAVGALVSDIENRDRQAAG